eukprot:TRINITY_DN2339_c0_g1_i2.p1 TRINITY_DN2339_c0_g1~~TRINITY_DN2339_c0_g1_i2.p1  ORF type:complete len:637 (-),score=122.52 TRINITY_DN2339_c0_g1_i2:246-2156(-)
MAAELVTRQQSGMTNFGIVAALLLSVVLGCFLHAELDLSQAHSTDSSSIYNFYVGVALMMFVGFGYLMTFLKAYGLGAVGFTMYITCLGVLFAIVVESYMGKGKLAIDFLSLLNGNFAVAAVLISFGGLIGKINPLQITVLVVVELLFYCFNKVCLLQQYAMSPLIADCGGTIIIHVFGAYFGLAAASVLGPPKDDKLNASVYTSDIFSLVGTVFLWLFWPSFVAGALPAGAGQTTALINTVLALLASTVVTFALTPMLQGGKLATVPVQNATLAGGVSIGATANLVGPFGALVIGGLAGLLSTVGFCKSPFFGDVDTCGISNLHGMPGIFGGMVSVLIPFMYEGTGVSAANQLNGMILTLCVSVSCGWATGKYLLLKLNDDSCEPFSDSSFWICSDDGQHKEQHESTAMGSSRGALTRQPISDTRHAEGLSSSESHSQLAGRIDNVEGTLSAQMSRVEARMLGMEQSVSQQMARLEAKLQGVTGSEYGPAILEQLNRIEAQARVAEAGHAKPAATEAAPVGPDTQLRKETLDEVLSQLKRLEEKLAPQDSSQATDGEVQAQLSRIENKLAAVQSRLPNMSRMGSTTSLGGVTTGSSQSVVPATRPTAMSPTRTTRTVQPGTQQASPYLHQYRNIG